MKQVLSLALFIAFFVQLISPAQAISVERLFKMSIHGKTEFKGRASSVLDSQMLNIETFMTFRKTYAEGSGWEVSFASNGNRWVQWRTHVLYPTNGEVHFALRDDKGDAVKFLMGSDGNERVVTHTERPKTYYIVESDFEYERRMERVDKLNAEFKKHNNYRATKYPKTGKFMAIVEFDINGPVDVDFFEVGEEDMKLTPIGTYRKNIK
jgi:hypothetical protein